MKSETKPQAKMKTQQTHELAGCCAMGLCGPGRAQEVRDQEALRKLTPSKIQKIIKQIHAGDKRKTELPATNGCWKHVAQWEGEKQ